MRKSEVGTARMTGRHVSLGFALSAFALVVGCGDRRDDAPSPSTGPSSDWRYFGNDAGGSQYAPLGQITRQNLHKLKIAWIQKSGDIISSVTAPEGRTAFEATPIMVNDTLYYSTPLNRVFALDPATGKVKWLFDPHTSRGPNGKVLLDKPRKANRSRGVAYWEASSPRKGVSCEKRILKLDTYGNVYALDANTGSVCADFGAASGHPGYVAQWDFNPQGQTIPTSLGNNSPPAIIDDMVIVASGSTDRFADAADGVVRAFDVRTGAFKWEFNPIPKGYNHVTGAANTWAPITVDNQRHLIFLATTSPSPDYYGGRRRVNIPYANATVALDAATGKVVWSYQIVRHDLWDYDLPTQPVLINIKKDGKNVPVVVQYTKMGYIYVFNRDTGKPIFPVAEYKAPQSNMPGEVTSRTQPIPLLPENMGRISVKESDIFGLTPIDRLWCKRKFRELKNEGIYTPPSEQSTFMMPSVYGIGTWGSVAFDPKSNSLIVRAQNLANYYSLHKKRPGDDDAKPDIDHIMAFPLPGTPYKTDGDTFWSPLGVPCTPPPWGTLASIDMNTGKVKWKVPLGQSKRYGVTLPSFLGWGSPGVGGPMVTASGIAFIGATLDEKFRAFDISNGKVIWEKKLGYPAMAVPMTYLYKGKQYVVVAAGGNYNAGTALGDELTAFTLKN